MAGDDDVLRFEQVESAPESDPAPTPPRRPPAPPPPPPPPPPRLERAGAELRYAALKRDARGAVVGERVGLWTRDEKGLLRALAVAARALPPSAEARIWTREGARLLVTSLAVLPVEARSVTLDDLAAALALAGAPAELFVGGGDLLPYESVRPGWDLAGTPGPETGVRLWRAGATRPDEGWIALSPEAFLPRLQPVPRRPPAPRPAWLLASGRLFQGLRARFHELGRPFAFAGFTANKTTKTACSCTCRASPPPPSSASWSACPSSSCSTIP